MRFGSRAFCRGGSGQRTSVECMEDKRTSAKACVSKALAITHSMIDRCVSFPLHPSRGRPISSQLQTAAPPSPIRPISRRGVCPRTAAHVRSFRRPNDPEIQMKSMEMSPSLLDKLVLTNQPTAISIWVEHWQDMGRLEVEMRRNVRMKLRGSSRTRSACISETFL